MIRLIHIILLLFLFSLNCISQSPPTEVHSYVAGENNAVSSRGDTIFVHSGTHFLHEYFNYTLSEDSIIILSDTIYTKVIDLVILDSITKQVVRTCKEVVDFTWNKNTPYVADYINPPTVASQKVDSRWTCYYIYYYYNQTAVCFCMEICDLNQGETFAWCSGSKYTKIFEDNFEGIEINRDYWNIGYGWGRYVNNHSPAAALNENVEVSNGTLKLKCNYKGNPPIYDNDGTSYTDVVDNNGAHLQTTFGSGAISTVLKFGYGKYEMRAKIPAINGVNPAYWIVNGDFEVDGFEFFDHLQGDQPLMTAYSDNNVGSAGTIPECKTTASSGIIPSSNWTNGNLNNNRMFQARAHRYGIWNTLPNLADGNWWNFSIVFDPNYITWWIENDNHTQAWDIILYNKAQTGQVNPNPNSNCSCTGCQIQYNTNFPINNGNTTFILQNEWNETKTSSGSIAQAGPPHGTTSVFEIDWVKIYAQDDCWHDRTEASGFFRAVDHFNLNQITGNNITLGGNGTANPSDEYKIKFVPWGQSAPVDGTPQTNAQVRANDELALLDGFSVDPDALFEGTISYHLGDNNSGVDSDCNLNVLNEYWPQIYRTGNTQKDSLSQTRSNSTKVYPNPTSDYVTVESSMPINKLEIYNALGQLLIQTTNAKEKINISLLSNGVYSVKAFFDNNVTISKFVKQ